MSFIFEQRLSDSPFVESIYRTETGAVRSFLSVATTRWAMVVTRQYGKTRLTLRGPETRATLIDCPEQAEFLGFVFKPGTLLPDLPASRFVDEDFDLPNARRNCFWLNGSPWEFPSFENADTFLAALTREDLLHHDPVVEAALRREPIDLSLRSVQRRFLQTTGLTHTAIRQIQRAQRAAHLLEQGTPILSAMERTGYSDQAHLTRSLKRFIGQTPAQLIRLPIAKSLY